MGAAERWRELLAGLPLVAVLRGVVPDEAADIAEALFDAGWRCVEVTLSSPQPLAGIAAIRARMGDKMVVGAGTVLTPAEVGEVAAAGAELIVSPNVDPAVIAQTKAAGLISLPGVFTPSEAFATLAAGAHGLKLFPAEAASPVALKALLAVLPPEAAVLPVGGIEPASMAPWRAAGAAGFGIGGALFRPGRTASDVAARAAAFAAPWAV
ncbi:MAG TPA: 2-dehydro-3-deoxy-6-phosphogalactonate aldolase [Caulobacteraceae bacterium]|nr:2-dehydro-3-deoxy-6-phosphogalactonate aldolase [Caulobacteraceae bacterium]